MGPVGEATPPVAVRLCERCGNEFVGTFCPKCALEFALDSDSGPGPNSSVSAPPEYREHPPERLHHFRIEKRPDGTLVELGRGGMGVTYKAIDERLRLVVALKVISPARMHDGPAQSLFLREARAAARVRHSNVASVLYLNDAPGQFFYAMEFVAGDSLQDWLKKRETSGPLLAIDLGIQIARGLGAIHAEGIIHRDLKPTNLMLVPVARPTPPRGVPVRPSAEPPSEKWLAKIIDFGLARPIVRGEEDTQSIGFRGTVLYASPEQCEEHPDLDGRSDLYSVGCILFQMLTGGPPFTARSHRELMNLHVTRPAPIQRLAHVPCSLAAIVARLLLKHPDERFPDAEALVKALEQSRGKIGRGEDSISAPTEQRVAEFRLVTPHSVAISPKEVNDSLNSDDREISFNGPVVPRALPDPLPMRSEFLPPPVARWIARWLVAAVALLFFAGALAPGFWISSHESNEAKAAKDKTSAGGQATPSPVSPNPAKEKSIAVLSLKNIGGQLTDGYFADGLQEEIIDQLAHIRDVSVIASTSVAKYRMLSAAITDIARELKVASILEGSVRRIGDTAVVNIRLVNGVTGVASWTRKFERKLTETLTLQTEIALAVAEQMQANMSTEEKTNLARAKTGNSAAYQLYLKARALMADTSEGRRHLNDSVAALKEAIEADPSFALAYAQLSQAHSLIYFYALDRGDFQIEESRNAAEKALALQPNLPEGMLALGYYYYRCGLDYKHAEELLARAESSLPSSAEVKTAIAALNRRLGRWEASTKLYREAARLNPLDPVLHRNWIDTLARQRKFEAAEQAMNSALQSMPDHPALTTLRADLYFRWRGDLQAQRDELVARRYGIPTIDFYLIDWITYLLRMKQFDTALEMLHKSTFVASDGQSRYVSRDALEAEILTQQGKIEEARPFWTRARMRLDEIVRVSNSALLDPRKRAARAIAYAGEGNFQSALNEADFLSTNWTLEKDHFDAPYFLEIQALVYLRCGNRPACTEILQRLLEIPSTLTLASIRGSTEWADIGNLKDAP